MGLSQWVPGAHRLAGGDPVERAVSELERQGSGLARVAHLVASLMVALFSLGSLVALSGDAFTAIVSTVEHGGVPGIPQAISILVSTLMVICCDVGLVYAAMTLRVLRVRGGGRDEHLLHWFVLLAVSVVEAGTYFYMSVIYEHPSGLAWGLVIARALMAPLLSVYLAMARPHPVTPRDTLHQAELAQGIQLVRDVVRVAQDPTASLADKMRSDRIEQRDRGSFGLLVSRTALAHPDPKHWSLSFAMRELYQAFEAESQKPGKTFLELVRRRRRELGLAVPPEERVLPFRSHPSGSLPALDLAIDHELDQPGADQTLSRLRTERRLEELDVAIEEAQRQGAPLSTRHDLEQAFDQELQTLQVSAISQASDDS